MRNFKYIFICFLAVLAVPSCVEDTAPEDTYGKGSNLASFRDVSGTLSGVSDGSEYDFNLPLIVKGPSMDGLSEDITANIVVDPASTAIEGVHYTLGATSVTFSKGNNYLNLLPITMLTEGIIAPLEESPILILRLDDVAGESNVIANGKPITLTLNYLCFSNLAGTYTVSVVRDDGATYSYTDEVAQTGDGQYRGTGIGQYPGGSLPGTPGFDFSDVCNVITVPEQNLADYYSNLVYGSGPSYVKPNGDLHIEIEITFAAGNRQYVMDYVKVD